VIDAVVLSTHLSLALAVYSIVQHQISGAPFALVAVICAISHVE
jgi:hypothetical protein